MTTRHGFSRRKATHPIYATWLNMRQRCRNPNNTCFSYYGGRGITICDRWSRFENFLEDMGSSWKPGLTIERINNDLGYSPSNCRWESRLVQANNSRKNIRFTFRGETLTLAQWAKKVNLPVVTIHERFHRGLDASRILSRKPSIASLARDNGIPYDWLHDKVKSRGLSVENAIALYGSEPDGRVWHSGRRKS
jgi:hypothetical protein